MNGYLLIARMEMDDLPLRLFATKKEMGEWLRSSDGTFEDEINRIVRLHGWSVEAMQFRNGKPVKVEHVMGFEHVE